MAISCYKVPQFFSVFLPHLCSHHLKISSSFKSNLAIVGGEASIKVSTTDQIWRVDLVMKDGEFFFAKGWDKFVIENALSVGEFMVFQYHGNSSFTVDIFGTSGLKKFTPAMHNVVHIDDDDTDDDSGKLNIKERFHTSAERKTPIEEAQNLMEKLKKKNRASFMVLMTASYIAVPTMHMPCEFMSRHMRKNNCAEVEFQISDKTWRVKMLSYRQSRLGRTYNKLGDGFAEFIRDNHVREGNVCVFQALNVPGTTFKVSIMRGA